MRKVNEVGKLDNCWQCGSDLVVEDDWGWKAVVCRKEQKGIGRCGEQQQEGVLKKAKKNRAAGRTRGESNAQQ